MIQETRLSTKEMLQQYQDMTDLTEQEIIKRALNAYLTPLTSRNGTKPLPANVLMNDGKLLSCHIIGREERMGKEYCRLVTRDGQLYSVPEERVMEEVVFAERMKKEND